MIVSHSGNSQSVSIIETWIVMPKYSSVQGAQVIRPRRGNASIDNNVSVNAQGPRPRLPTTLLGMNDLEIDDSQANYVRNVDVSCFYDRNIELPESFKWKVSHKSLPYHPVRFGISELDKYSPRSFCSQFRLLFALSSSHQKSLHAPSLQSYPILSPSYIGPNPIFCIREDVPDPGTRNYLTNVDFDNPKPPTPCPVNHTILAEELSRHRPTQSLVLLNPSAFRGTIQKVDYLYICSDFG